jgi:hypothetical protein
MYKPSPHHILQIINASVGEHKEVRDILITWIQGNRIYHHRQNYPQQRILVVEEATLKEI